MEPEKISKFYNIQRIYKGRVTKRTYENEEYREKKIFNFYLELFERLDMIWLMTQRIFNNIFLPIRTLEISLDRVISKFSFCPPRDTYVFSFENQSAPNGEILLAQFATAVNTKLIRTYKEKFCKINQYIECFYTKSKYGNRIACIYIHGPAMDNLNKTIVYSHTNAEDIGSMISYLWRLRKKVRCNVFSYDYSGYGMSSGCPSERNLYADVEAAVYELMRKKSITYKDIIFFGESIGSAPTVFIASLFRNAFGVVLQSSFMSAIRIYFPYSGPTMIYDPFPNIERVPKIESKTLIIHGTEDMLVDISHAIAMYRALKNPATPFWINGAKHMSMHKHANYYERLNYFIYNELSDSDNLKVEPKQQQQC